MRHVEVSKYQLQDMLDILAETEPGAEERHMMTATTRRDYGPAYTFRCEGRILACAGVTIYWEGMGEVWLATSLAWKQYAREAVIMTRNVLDFLQDNNKLRRIQADVVTANLTACRFVEHFGFKSECVMRKYDVLGRDCTRYSRIREAVV